MCGRYTLTINIQNVAEKFGVDTTSESFQALQNAPRYNIAPTQNIVTVLRNGSTHLAELRWGLIPSWAKDASIGSRMINARAETLAEKPSFRGLLRSKRCLIVADGFYEWKQEHGQKTPMYFSLKDHEPFAFAGLWDSWNSPDGEQVRSCTIITTEANTVVAPVHDRMPVILLPEAYDAWLDTGIKDDEMLAHWLKPYPADVMAARPVSRLVNNPKYDSPELLA